MAQPYVGEIRMFAGNFAPMGWELCHGQLLSIPENETLFMLIGTTYGGDGENTFAVPDMRGRVPIHSGNGAGPGLTARVLGERGGVETVTLNLNQLPNHTHGVTATRDAANSTSNATTGIPSIVAATNVYGSVGTPGAMAANVIGSQGGNMPHENMAPFLSVNFIISLFGIFPMQP